MALTPFEWKDRPALIEHLFPVQKISAESFKEQMAGAGKTLTALGSYWKGRKPLILNKACILGSLLPATDDPLKDLEIFELLMGMDTVSMQQRIEEKLPASRRDTVGDFLVLPYNEQVINAKRPEEMDDSFFDLIWPKVNHHLGTTAFSFPELVEQMGIARFGRRPKVADVFCGSGQIPFEAARLGCDVYASDLNPIACMLTWGAFNIVGVTEEKRTEIENFQKVLIEQVQKDINKLKVETDGKGWIAKVYLYCLEVVCPESGWRVPLLPSLVVSNSNKVIAELIPVPSEKQYHIKIRYVDTDEQLDSAKFGTIQDGYVVHSPEKNTQYRVNIKTIRGDHREENHNKNRLRMWEKSDFVPCSDDIFQERLYCIQWMKKKPKRKNYFYEFRSVTEEDLLREQKVIDYVSEHLDKWQEKGYIPDMMIEEGDKTDEPIRTRGWTYWHHLFNPRQLFVGSLYSRYSKAISKFGFTRILNQSCKLSRWDNATGSDKVQGVFDNQALNTVYNYGTRSGFFASNLSLAKFKNFPIIAETVVRNHSAQHIDVENDIYITDPPYGDAVKYEEITEFFIAWLRRNPPEEFSHWTWDSRRSGQRHSGVDVYPPERGHLGGYGQYHLGQRSPGDGGLVCGDGDRFGPAPGCQCQGDDYSGSPQTSPGPGNVPG